MVFILHTWLYMGIAECAKTGENARPRSLTALARPIFDICDPIQR